MPGIERSVTRHPPFLEQFPPAGQGKKSNFRCTEHLPPTAFLHMMVYKKAVSKTALYIIQTCLDRLIQ